MIGNKYRSFRIPDFSLREKFKTDSLKNVLGTFFAFSGDKHPCANA